jgi:hypothetical protein
MWDFEYMVHLLSGRASWFIVGAVSIPLEEGFEAAGGAVLQKGGEGGNEC